MQRAGATLRRVGEQLPQNGELTLVEYDFWLAYTLAVFPCIS